MFSNLDRDDFANIGKVVGIALFVIAFLFPAVHEGSSEYRGFECAYITATTALGMILSRGGSPSSAEQLFDLAIIVSGAISPLIVMSFFFRSPGVRRVFAIAVFVLMIAPCIVFGMSREQSGFGSSEAIRPLIGHYFWMIGGVLIFAPELVGICRKSRSESQVR